MSHRDNPECMKEINKQSVKQKAENLKHIREINSLWEAVYSKVKA